MRDPISVQRIQQLNPYLNVKKIFTDFIDECENTFDITLRIMLPVFRSTKEQQALYEQGRTTPGSIVSNSKGGTSFHNYGLAIDICEYNHLQQKEMGWTYDNSILEPIAKKYGLEWGGEWVHIKDKPHFELRMGYKENCSDLALVKKDVNGYPILTI